MKQSSYKGRARQRSNGRKKSYSNNGNNNNNIRKNSFDSTGPVGKVRGTASFVLEKYMTAARDASTNDDTVLAENCFQHADHYTRIHNTILEAQQKQDQERQERNRQKEAKRQQAAEKSKANNVVDGNIADGQSAEKNDVVAEDNQSVGNTESAPEIKVVQVDQVKEKSADKAANKSDAASDEKPVKVRKPCRAPRKKPVVQQTENVTVVSAPEIMSI
ncbi:MAG: DUF4167 domain-containing protein [Alphaproteobacteria bacterium]|nr:DUF4167 domain-containing protein [Alphaproteobacteria bacterium]